MRPAPMRTFLTGMIAAFCFVLIAARGMHAQSLSATTIPSAGLMPPATLNEMLQAKQAPLILQVGSHVLFEEAHIAGARYAGPGSQPQGLEKLDQAVAGVSKDAPIVLYCGCCPWGRCPNIAPAWKHLHDLGYAHVQALYLENNFGDDWVAKGYPTAHGGA